MTETVKEFPDDHCSRWSGIPQKHLISFHRQSIELLAVAFRTGVYNMRINWERATFHPLPYTRVVVSQTPLATWDFDAMTRLVIGAHDACIRVSVAAVAPYKMEILMHPRDRQGSMSKRHPTIEEAIADYRTTARR